MAIFVEIQTRKQNLPVPPLTAYKLSCHAKHHCKALV